MAWQHFQLFKSQAVLWPTALRVDSGVGESCCAIHQKVDCEVAGALGCQSWSRGTHRSVAVLYDEHAVNTYCHAQVGQLVLDRQVKDEALVMRRFGCRPFGCGRVLGDKYFRGYSATVSSYGAGYCYLVGFPANVRSRVARILGPLPLVADVLRVLRVVGDAQVCARWSLVGDGVYHVEAVESKKPDPFGFFFDAWQIVAETGGRARVGVSLCGLCISRAQFIDDDSTDCSSLTESSGEVYRNMTIRQFLYWFFILRWVNPRQRWSDTAGAFVDPVEAMVDRLVQGEGISYGSVECVGGEPVGVRVPDVSHVDGASDPAYGYCDVCKIVVRLENHEERCKVIEDPLIGQHRFHRSQLGDALHRFDVRLWLILTGAPKVEIGYRQDLLARKEAQAAWYEKYKGKKEPATGGSPKSLSTAFEASYSGTFRAAYRAEVLPLVNVYIPEHVKPFLECRLF